MSFRLLDSDIADSEVRKLAVEKLNVIPIPDMKYYMLQLVQVSKPRQLSSIRIYVYMKLRMS